MATTVAMEGSHPVEDKKPAPDHENRISGSVQGHISEIFTFESIDPALSAKMHIVNNVRFD